MAKDRRRHHLRGLVCVKMYTYQQSSKEMGEDLSLCSSSSHLGFPSKLHLLNHFLSANPLYLWSTTSQNHRTILQSISRETGGDGTPRREAPHTHFPAHLSEVLPRQPLPSIQPHQVCVNPHPCQLRTNKDEYPRSHFRLGLTTASLSPHLPAFLTHKQLCYLLLLTSPLRIRTQARLLTLDP